MVLEVPPSAMSDDECSGGIWKECVQLVGGGEGEEDDGGDLTDEERLDTVRMAIDGMVVGGILGTIGCLEEDAGAELIRLESF